MYYRFGTLLTFAVVSLTVPLLAQVTVDRAELSVPFGTIPGRLISVGDSLVFADDERPEASFMISRSDVRELSMTGDILSIETVKPVTDRTGEPRSKLSFRMGAPSSRLMAWFRVQPTSKENGVTPATGTVNSSNQVANGGARVEGATHAESSAKSNGIENPLTYQAKHDHFVGSCNGRLIVQPGRVLFESITELSHSRQWSMRDIKELKRDNPYNLKVAPFTGETYNLEIQGRGVDSNEYRDLVDRVTAARAQP